MPSGFFGNKYSPPAVAFDGSTYLTRGAALTGAANSAYITTSVWFNITGGTDGTFMQICGVPYTGNRTCMGRTAANFFRVMARDTIGTSWYENSTNTYTPTSNPGWHHAVWSTQFDGINTGGYYIDGVSTGVGDTYGPATLNWSLSNWAVGANTTGGELLTGQIAQLYVNQSTFVNLENSSVRAKFYNNGPVDFGADGSIPTGTQPIVFMNNPAASFGTNRGYGGNFSVTAGSLTNVAGP